MVLIIMIWDNSVERKLPVFLISSAERYFGLKLRQNAGLMADEVRKLDASGARPGLPDPRMRSSAGGRTRTLTGGEGYGTADLRPINTSASELPRTAPRPDRTALPTPHHWHSFLHFGWWRRLPFSHTLGGSRLSAPSSITMRSACLHGPRCTRTVPAQARAFEHTPGLAACC